VEPEVVHPSSVPGPEAGTGRLGRTYRAFPNSPEARKAARRAAHPPKRQLPRKRIPRVSGAFEGGARRDRTGDLRLAKFRAVICCAYSSVSVGRSLRGFPV
jgi:hypothetical protein